MLEIISVRGQLSTKQSAPNALWRLEVVHGGMFGV
jgi:hypothetical protein